MKKYKKILLWTGVVFFLLLGGIAAIPFIFKDQLLAKTKDAINDSLNAKVEFSGVSLSIFKNFPNISMNLKDFYIEGIGVFEGIRLIETPAFEISVDLKTAIKADTPLKINEIRVKDPNVNVLVTKEGIANYLIMKPAEEPLPETPDSLRMDAAEIIATLEKIVVENARVYYDDASLDLRMNIEGLDHTSKGDVSAVIYNLDTRTTVDQLSVTYGSIDYLTRAKATMDAVFRVNQDSSVYAFADNNIKVNELTLVADGFFQMLEQGYAMDIQVKAPENDFKDLFSLIPGAYLEGYEAVKATGTFALEAGVKGIYNDSLDLMPAYDVRLEVANGSVKYPDLPLGISGINSKMRIFNPASALDSLKVDVPHLSLNIGRNPIDAVFFLRTPMSDPYVDGKVNGILDLAELSKAFPMQGLKELRGRITADVAAKARMSQIDRQQYESLNMRGNMRVENVVYRSADYPDILVKDMRMEFSPRFVEIKNLNAKAGKSDFEGSGRVDNILAYFSPKSTMKGALTLRSKLIDANEFLALASEETTAVPSANALSAAPPALPQEQDIFNRFDFTLDAAVDQILYDKYDIRNSVARGNITPNRFLIQQASTEIGNSDIQASGVITNAFDYFFDDATLGGKLTLNSRRLDLNQFMTMLPESSESAGTAASDAGGAQQQLGVIQVPDKIALEINANVGELNYTDFTIKNLKGILDVEDRTVALRDVQGSTLGGDLKFNGLYDTQNENKPAYSVKLDLVRMNFQQSFSALNTFKTLAPIGQFINGIFTSSFLMEGSLGNNMMPRIDDLTMKGFLETVNATLRGFKPLQTMGAALNIEELKEEVRITDTKNWIEVKKGVVEVKPFDVRIKDMDLTIGGTHSLAQNMNYDIKVKIPYKKFEKSSIGAAASSGINLVRQQASRLGINIARGEYVNILVNMTGSIKDPKLNYKLLGMDGETPVEDELKATAKAELEQAKQELTQKAQEELNKYSAQAKEAAGKAIDTLSSKAQEELEKKKAELASKAQEVIEKEVGQKLGDTLSKTAQKQAEKVLDSKKAQEEVNKLKNELEKFNPLKKRTTPPPDTTKKN